MERDVVVIPPYRWQGESECLVGPFNSLKVARFFLDTLSVDHLRDLSESCLVMRAGAWYLDTRLAQPDLGKEVADPGDERR